MRSTLASLRTISGRALQVRDSFTCNSHQVPSIQPAELPVSSHACLLPHRALVRVCGNGTSPFLQGLVTADVTLEMASQYAMFLSPQGRVLYDIILYKNSEDDHLLECDTNVATSIIRHMKKYALRSKIQISPADPNFNLWAVFPGSPGKPMGNTIFSTLDPRVAIFGTRVITSGGVKTSDLWEGLEGCSVDDYHGHRLEMGIAEGNEEIPSGNCFPLEYNLDYLNGVSFSKGCYIGQELTARTHHTGVVRKRVMPITLDRVLPGGSLPPPGTAITSSSGKTAGKLICLQEELGLALLRLREVTRGGLTLKTPEGDAIGVTAHTPSWWPADQTVLDKKESPVDI